MGDRGNVVVDDGDDGRVYLYCHWNGYDLPGILAEALASPEGRRRASDGSYLTRIIFQHILEKCGGLEKGNRETGFGISARLTDNEYPLLVVKPRERSVVIEREGHEGVALRTMTMAEYANLNYDDARVWRDGQPED